MAKKIIEYFKDKAFKAGFAAGFSVSRPGMAADDWDEDLHPRDEAGRFAFSGEGAVRSTGGKNGSSANEGVPTNVLGRLKKLQGEYDKGVKAEKEIGELARKHAEAHPFSPEELLSGKMPEPFNPPREKVEQMDTKNAIETFKRAVDPETGKIRTYILAEIYREHKMDNSLLKGADPAMHRIIKKLGLEKDYDDYCNGKGRWTNAKHGYGVKPLSSMAHDDWDEDLHPRDDDGKFTFGGAGGSSSGGKGKGGKEKGGKKEEKHEPAMGEILKEKFEKVAQHIANAEENAKMYAERMARDPNELTRHNMENSLIEAKEYENVIRDLGYSPAERKDHYEPAEWDRDHAYEKLKQLADLAKEFDTIGHKISAGSNMEIYNKARESIRAHMSARLRAIQDLGLNNDYKDWKEACGYGDITGWDDIDWNDLS